MIGMMCFSLVFSQDWKKSPKENERVIGTVMVTHPKSILNWADEDNNMVYKDLLSKAKEDFPNKSIDLRNVIYSVSRHWEPTEYVGEGKYRRQTQPGYYYHRTYMSATVIELPLETRLNEILVKTVDKALSRVSTGSRLAIDQVSVSGGLDRATVKDQLVDILLDNSYKVVAKEYLEKLKEEQAEQLSGSFNEKTTAKVGNFSGVGYFVNVRVTEKSIRIQVVNVSTGEYEGNATVEF